MSESIKQYYQFGQQDWLHHQNLQEGPLQTHLLIKYWLEYVSTDFAVYICFSMSGQWREEHISWDGGQREGDVSEDVKWQLSSVSKLKTIIVCYANN